MKQYKQVPEDAEYREYYDSYRLTVDNLNDTDYLYFIIKWTSFL